MSTWVALFVFGLVVTAMGGLLCVIAFERPLDPVEQVPAATVVVDGEADVSRPRGTLVLASRDLLGWGLGVIAMGAALAAYSWTNLP